jgi:hypothetical protein
MMSEERAVPLTDWPQPDAGAPSPLVIADDTRLFVRYITQNDKIAVIHFPLCSIFTFGSPNDEALAGHPLHGRGLEHYSAHRVESSSWIALLERRNAVHPSHDKKRFLENKRHFIFTFHDSTLECVVNEGKFWPTEISEFDSETQADRYIESKKDP